MEGFQSEKQNLILFDNIRFLLPLSQEFHRSHQSQEPLDFQSENLMNANSEITNILTSKLQTNV
jgi:hypothetical protein